MPVITYGDDNVGQSAAIHYFLAAEMKLMGSSNLEAAQILAVYEHLREMMLAYREVVPYGDAPSAEATAMWFEYGATDYTGTADSSMKTARMLPWWMGRIENALDDGGFAVGQKLSLADIALYYFFSETLTDEETPDDFESFKRFPFGNKSRMDEAISYHPRIAASISAVKANTNFQKWLKMRGPQEF